MTPDNAWTTVTGRKAPVVEAAARGWASGPSAAPATRTWTSGAPSASFGQRGSSDHTSRRREEAEWAAHQVRDKQAAEEKARKDAAAKLNFTSEKEYPSLGAKKTAPLPKKTALNFAATAAAAAALPDPHAPADEDFRNPEAMVRRSRIGNRCWDDGPLDYDGPEEDEMPPYEEGDEEDPDAEYNADTVSDRRRGDNGIW
jgi:hypothetical protein